MTVFAEQDVLQLASSDNQNPMVGRAARLRQSAVVAIALALAAAPGSLAARQNAPSTPVASHPGIPATYVTQSPGSAFPRWTLSRSATLGPVSVADLYGQTVAFARCVQRSHPEKLRQLLEKPVSSRAEAFATKQILKFEPGCDGKLPNRPASARIIRGAAAEAMLSTIVTSDPDVAKTVNTAKLDDFHAAMPKVGSVRDTTSGDVQKVVECQVVLAPGLARKLIESRPGSREDGEFRQRIADASVRCGTIATAGLTSEVVYRAYLAEALYHWSSVGIGNRYS
jgi:hypothetical protein